MDGILKPLLKLKQGGVLEKHHGKGAHQAVMDIVNPGSIARVQALRKTLGEDFTKSGEAYVFFDMQMVDPNICTIYRQRLPHIVSKV